MYGQARTQADVEAFQLDRLNECWRILSRSTPYYSSLRESRGLGEQFESLEHFSASVPILTRADIQRLQPDLTVRGSAPELFRVTGGSTAEPVRIPAWRSEAGDTDPDMWAARSWYGIAPSDRCFLLWGHSHLFGSGLAARWRQMSRRLRDRLLGYRRFSAYDLDEHRLGLAIEAIAAFRPDYVIGYSVALHLLALASRQQPELLPGLGLKAVIATAESFHAPADRNEVQRAFGCEVALEYGCVECGVIAHTAPGAGFRTMWVSHLVEAVPRGSAHRLVVTSLFPRSMGLLRYEVGDEVDAGLAEGTASRSLLGFHALKGRSNNAVAIPSGRIIHSEAFTHAVRGIPGIAAFQVLVREGRVPRLLIVAREPRNRAPIAEEARVRLGRLDPLLAGIEVAFEDKPRETMAGKRPMILRDTEDP
jgi:phenylacetate-CoA ligase